MDTRLDTLASMLDKTAALVNDVGPDQHRLATPCADFDVAALLNHLAVWIQVFEGAVNDTTPDFDPFSHQVEGDVGETLERSSKSMIAGLRARGFDRMMTMTADPIAGEFILNMVLMEYIGHGWDLARATGRPVPYGDDEAAVALAAAQAIIEPEYRGTGMFGAESDVGDEASQIDRFVAFLGRDPGWMPGSAA